MALEMPGPRRASQIWYTPAFVPGNANQAPRIRARTAGTRLARSIGHDIGRERHPGGRCLYDRPEMHLVLRTDAGANLPVALGPVWVVERHPPEIRPGDRLDVTVFRIVRGKPALVACEVKKGNETRRLRDRYGVPLWRHRGPRRRP